MFSGRLLRCVVGLSALVALVVSSLSGAADAASVPLTASAVTARAHATSGPDGGDPLALGRRFLERRFQDGLYHDPTENLVDDFQGIQAARSLQKAGADATVDAFLDALEPYVASDMLTYGDGYFPVDAVNAAYLVVLLVTAGRDPRAYGGRDLVALLDSHLSNDPGSSGRLAVENYSFATAVQATAVEALALADDPHRDDAVDFLLRQQCAEGFFRAGLGDDENDTCDAAQAQPDGLDEADVETTAVAGLSLLDVPTPAAQQAAGAAESWLLSSDPRADITDQGVRAASAAAQFLGAMGDTAAATRAAGVIRSRQIALPAPCVERVHRRRENAQGAVAGTDSFRDNIVSTGADRVTLSWLSNTTVPTLPALAFAPRARRHPIVRPQHGRQARTASKLRLSLTRFAPNSYACVVRGSGKSRVARSVLVDDHGAAHAAVPAGRRPGAQRVRVIAIHGEAGHVTFHLRPRHRA